MVSRKGPTDVDGVSRRCDHEIVRQNGIELQRLIENLIDYNQIPRQELTIESFDIDRLWQELLNNYAISIDRKALRLAMRGEVDNWAADRYKLKTTLDNLLSNAVNYTPDGGEIDIVWCAASLHSVAMLVIASVTRW